MFVSLQFEQENQRLIGEMNSLFDEVRYVCGSFVSRWPSLQLSPKLGTLFTLVPRHPHVALGPNVAPLPPFRGSRKLPEFTDSPRLVGL